MKLVIADDERLVRVLIKSMIPFDKLDMELVYEASDGQEALDFCMQNNPDILITDINMPVLSGLDLIKELRAVSPKMKIIIVSGYNDFAYAKAAIKYDVFDYILKPIDEKDLVGALTSIRTLIAGEKDDYKEKVKDIKSSRELNNYINGLIQDILKEYNSRSSSINPVEVAKSFIESNYQCDISLDQIADCVHLNRTYFSGLFKKETGYSFIEYKTLTRVENAKRYLSSTDSTVNEISNKIGYADPKHFCKLFKRHTGMTPSEFREIGILST